MPKFTIGVPTYNRAKWIGNAIECALGQTYRDLEVIVSDIASTVSTADVVRKFGNRVRYIRNETNIGAARNYCKLVELATGE
jgi:glycosyltransferase involved in cell wall biosynthesis